MPEPLARLRTGSTLYELEDEKTTIGRDPTCDLVVDARGISRLHATLVIAPNATVRRAILQDNDSSNGTFVNGQRVPPHESFPLNHGDLIFFSAYEKTSYRFELPGQANLPLPNMVLPPAKVPIITGDTGSVPAAGARKRSASPASRRFDQDADPRYEPLPPGSRSSLKRSLRNNARDRSDTPMDRPEDMPTSRRDLAQQHVSWEDERTPSSYSRAPPNSSKENRPPNPVRAIKSEDLIPGHGNVPFSGEDDLKNSSWRPDDSARRSPWGKGARDEQVPVLADRSSPLPGGSPLPSPPRSPPKNGSPGRRTSDQECGIPRPGWELAQKAWDILPDQDMRLLEQTFMSIRDCACFLAKGEIPDVEVRVPTRFVDYPLFLHRLARRLEDKVLRKRMDDSCQTEEGIVEPREVCTLKETLEEQTKEMQELRRQIAFFHSYFPEDVVKQSMNTRVEKARDVITTGQLTPKDAQELLETLVLAQRGLQEQDRRQAVCQRRWRQLLEDLSAQRADNSSLQKMLQTQRERHKEALEACDATLQSCRQQLEALAGGVTQDALRVVNNQLDALESERQILNDKLEETMIEKEKYENMSKTEKLRREKADKLYRQAEEMQDKLDELQRSTAPERVAQLEELICHLEHKLSHKIPCSEAERTAEADWRTFAIQARQDARRLQMENEQMKKSLTSGQIPTIPIPENAAIVSVPPPKPTDTYNNDNNLNTSLGGGIMNNSLKSNFMDSAVPPATGLGAPLPFTDLPFHERLENIGPIPSSTQTAPQGWQPEHGANLWGPPPTASDFWGSDPVSANPGIAKNPHALDIALPDHMPVKEVCLNLNLPEDEMSVRSIM